MKILKKNRRVFLLIAIAVVLVLGIAAGLFTAKTWVFFDADGLVTPVTIRADAGESPAATQETALAPPAGYTRTTADGFAAYLRGLPMKADNTVLTWNGKNAGQDAAAVYQMDLGAGDVQQCADSIIRLYAEYFYAQSAYDKITFSLTNGDVLRYTDWRAGKRLLAAGSFSAMVKLAGEDDSYAAFRKYLGSVMHYAGTKSLAADSTKLALADLTVGDLLLHPGTPGHVMLVVDEAVNADGARCFLFAQGYTPAQDFHVVKNALHPADPWFYENELAGGAANPGNFTASDLYRLNIAS
ncbi:MAG: DUF4846 domain-containing protein [Oscillospiraceae bacterium]